MAVVVRGDVWLTRLDPTVGSEIRKARPCLIISSPETHDHLRTCMIAAMTTGSRAAPYRIPVTFDGTDGRILLDQVRTIDKSRLLKRLGAIDAAALSSTLAALRLMFED